MSQVNVYVQYCGGWGYKRFYDALVNAIEDRFGDQVKCTPQMDPGATGNFEVKVGTGDKESATLVHSKKGGKGRAESQAEKDDIFAAIQAKLDGK